MRFYCLFCIIIILFGHTAFAEQNLPDYVVNKEEAREYSYYKNYGIDDKKHQEYIDDYKVSQITATEISLSTGNITICTEGSFLTHNSAYARPSYIKIKEDAAGVLEKGSIYLTIDEGTLLKEMKCTTTSGDIIASAVGNSKTIKIEIEQQSTMPSEITITNLTILTNRMNENEWKERECILSVSVSNELDKNLFSEYSTENIILNTRFWAQHNTLRQGCGGDYYIGGRLSFTADKNYYMLNDTKFDMEGSSYIKDNTLMVPVYSLGEALFLDSIYSVRYNYSIPYGQNDFEHSHFLNWYDNNQSASILYRCNVLFQNQSNIAQTFYDYDEKDFTPKSIDDTIEMPTNAEIKYGVLYVPVRSAIDALTYNNTNFYWDEKTKTFYYNY